MKFYTTDEVADILNASRYTVQKYIREGKLEAIKIGRRYLVKEEFLENMIEREKVK